MPAGMQGVGGETRQGSLNGVCSARQSAQTKSPANRRTYIQLCKHTHTHTHRYAHTHMHSHSPHSLTHTHSLQQLWMCVLRFISFLICAQPQKIETFCAVESAICCPAEVRVQQGGANIVDSRAWCRLSKWLCLQELLSVAKSSKVQRAACPRSV